MGQTYKNGAPRFGSEKWCRQVADNPNLTPYDHARFAIALRKAGNLKGLVTMQKLLSEKLNQKQP